MLGNVVIGVDGGGSHTRAMAVRLDGRVLSYVETGGANPGHNSDGKENVRQAIAATIAEAGAKVEDVAYVVSGFAGLDSGEDEAWADDFTALPGLACTRLQVNDAVIAHAGALQSRPGLIVILGTGSILFAVTEDGRQIRNYDFRHYAAATARHLAYDAVFRIIAGQFCPEDEELVQQVLAYWEAPDIAALCQMGSNGFRANRQECNRQFGNMAPMLTHAAARGVPLARAVCDAGAEAAATGVRLLGQCFRDEDVSVSLIGSVARSEYMAGAIGRKISGRHNKAYRILKPAYSAVAGAVLMGLERLGIDPAGTAARELAQHPQAQYEEA